MLHQKIYLTDEKDAYLITYLHDRYEQDWEDVGEWLPPKRPALILLPGGGYSYCSDREGEPVAYPFLCAGYNVFVLIYRTGDKSVWPAPLEDVAKAVWTVRQHADEWNIDPCKIAVGGFSAGGNLTSILGTQWHRGVEERLGIPRGGSRPDAMLLAYAPVEMEQRPSSNTQLGALLKDRPEELSSVRYVDNQTPPAFIWHTVNDEKVPVKNALLFAAKCLEFQIPFELHIFEHSPHGLSLNSDLTAYHLEHPVNVSSWVPCCIDWLNKLFAF